MIEKKKGYRVKLWAQTKVSFAFYVNVEAENEKEAISNAIEQAEEGISDSDFSVYRDSIGLEIPEWDTLEDNDETPKFEESEYDICMDEVENFYCLENSEDIEEIELEYGEEDEEEEEEEEE